MTYYKYLEYSTNKIWNVINPVGGVLCFQTNFFAKMAVRRVFFLPFSKWKQVKNKLLTLNFHKQKKYYNPTIIQDFTAIFVSNFDYKNYVRVFEPYHRDVVIMHGYEGQIFSSWKSNTKINLKS